MKRIECVIRPDRFDHVAEKLKEAGLAGFTIADVRGHGQSPEKTGEWRGQTYELSVTHKLQVTIIVEDEEVVAAIEAVVTGAYTGNLGDGLITVSDVVAVYNIRNGVPSRTN
jgi:nitrogen regulatory protein P-II 1